MRISTHIIPSAILLAVVVALLGCGKDRSVEPAVPPRIVAVSPADGATYVNVTKDVTVEFSETIDPTTVTSANFYFLDPLAGQLITDSKTVRFIPADSLQFSTTYTVVVTRGIRATNGEPLEKGKSWSFTTAPKPITVHPPVITGFSPTGVYAGVLLTITGHDFWNAPGYTQTYINGVQAATQSIDTNKIVVMVPANATTGRISVRTPISTDTSTEILTVYQPGDVWGQITPPTDYSLSAVCWTGQRFVAVGNLGTILTSEDGFDWIARSSGTVSRLNDVLATGSGVVAVGSGGTIVTSPDGLIWQLQQSDTTATISGVTRGSVFMAVGSSGLILQSDNAVAWNPVPPFTGEWLYDVAATSRGYLAVGHDGTMAASTTITSWLTLTSGTTEHLLAAEEINGTTIVVGYNGTILTSTDLRNWTEQVSGTTAHLGGISFTDDRVVVVGDEGTILTSPTGSTWQMQNSQTLLPLYDAAFSGERLVAVGDSGCIVLSPYIPGLTVAPGSESLTESAF